MIDDYNSQSPGLSSPAVDAETIVPNDSGTLAHVTRAIYVGGAGNLAIELASGKTVTLRSAIAGSILPLRVKKVFSSGTTASGLVGLW